MRNKICCLKLSEMTKQSKQTARVSYITHTLTHAEEKQTDMWVRRATLTSFCAVLASEAEARVIALIACACLAVAAAVGRT